MVWHLTDPQTDEAFSLKDGFSSVPPQSCHVHTACAVLFLSVQFCLFCLFLVFLYIFLNYWLVLPTPSIPGDQLA